MFSSRKGACALSPLQPQGTAVVTASGRLLRRHSQLLFPGCSRLGRGGAERNPREGRETCFSCHPEQQGVSPAGRSPARLSLQGPGAHFSIQSCHLVLPPSILRSLPPPMLPLCPEPPPFCSWVSGLQTGSPILLLSLGVYSPPSNQSNPHRPQVRSCLSSTPNPATACG